jgi:hypothetical protein
MHSNDPIRDFKRRAFLRSGAYGLGAIALRSLLEEGRAQTIPDINPLAPKKPLFPAKAKNVIFLFMSGGPSQLDLFDPKPGMRKWDGQPLPPSMTKDLQLAFIKPTSAIWASPRAFRPFGQSGIEISEWLPELSKRADDICLVRSMFTEQFNHNPGELMLSCGSPLVGRPSMGAWVTYGLGSESRNLPGFVVLSSGQGTAASSQNWSSGFLPASHQGVPLRSKGAPVLYLSDPPGIRRDAQLLLLDAVGKLNRQHYVDTEDPDVVARINSYELAYRMQTAAPELLDFSKESPATLDLYGVNNETTRPFAVNCLLARRMVERGVRFIELFHASWDDHKDLNKNLKQHCDVTDQPSAALLADLKQRGLLDSTLVVWAGEFGRTPLVEKTGIDAAEGRDHHPSAFSVWLAGGGIKGGQVIGKTDELGMKIVEDKVHVHDLHATMLHCLGLDHQRLTYRSQGRDFRLTDVAGSPVLKMFR